MGVRGLSTFVAHIPSAWSTVLRKHGDKQAEVIRLVVDAFGLVFYLDNNLTIDWRYGGDYRRFATELRKYFGDMANAGIEMFLVANGLPQESKFDQHLNRERETLQRINRMFTAPAEHVPHSKGIISKLTFQTCFQVVKELKMKLLLCDIDTDTAMYYVANKYNASLVAMDSDFYILDLVAGFIILDSIRITPAGVSCKKYNKESLATELKFSPKMFPLFASVIGNDYITDEDLLKLQKHIFKSHLPSNTQGMNYKHALIRAIGIFLGTFGEDQKAALNAIEEIIAAEAPEPKKGEKWGETDENDDDLHDLPVLSAGTEVDRKAEAARIRGLIEHSISMFTNRSKDITDPQDGVTVHIPAEAEDWEGGIFPRWLVDLYRKGDLDWKIMLILVRRRFWGHVLLESPEMPSAYLAARPLRRYLYSVLFKRENAQIVELLRNGTNFGPENVTPLAKTIGGEPIPHITKLKEMNPEQVRAAFWKLFDFSKDQLNLISALPENQQLAAALVNWWIRDSPTKVPVFDIILMCICITLRTFQHPPRRPGFNKHAADLTARFITLVEAGNLLTSAFFNTVEAVSTSVVDGFTIHLLHDELRKNHRDVHGLVLHHTTSIEAFWLVFLAATCQVIDKMEGHADMNEDDRRIFVTKPTARAMYHQLTAESFVDTAADPKQKKGKAYDAAVKKVGNVSHDKKEKVGSIFNALNAVEDDASDNDNEDKSGSEHESDAESEEQEEEKPAKTDSKGKKSNNDKNNKKDNAAAKKGDAGKDKKQDAASGSKKKTGNSEVDALLSQLESIDLNRKKAADAKLEKERLKKEKRKQAAASEKK